MVPFRVVLFNWFKSNGSVAVQSLGSGEMESLAVPNGSGSWQMAERSGSWQMSESSGSWQMAEFDTWKNTLHGWEQIINLHITFDGIKNIIIPQPKI